MVSLNSLQLYPVLKASEAIVPAALTCMKFQNFACAVHQAAKIITQVSLIIFYMQEPEIGMSFSLQECSSGASITRMPQCMDYSNVADSYINVAEEEPNDNTPTWMLKDHGSTRECKQSRLLSNNIMF